MNCSICAISYPFFLRLISFGILIAICSKVFCVLTCPDFSVCIQSLVILILLCICLWIRKGLKQHVFNFKDYSSVKMFIAASLVVPYVHMIGFHPGIFHRIFCRLSEPKQLDWLPLSASAGPPADTMRSVSKAVRAG
jgi:hypothetical protein